MKKANEIIDDSVKATLFGKFYEKIVLGWFREKNLYEPFEGKPRIYWKDVEFVVGDSEPSRIVNEALKEKREDKQYCTPDGFLQKDGRYYIWEAKNWALWSEGKKPLDQLTELLFEMPLILATKTTYRNQEYHVTGILFSWWSRPEGDEALIETLSSLIAPRTFQIFFTADVLEDCIHKKYPWYLQLVQREKDRTEEFFSDLMT